MSNEDIEMTIVRKIIDNPNIGGFEYQGYYIYFTNKRIITFFFVIKFEFLFFKISHKR